MADIDGIIAAAKKLCEPTEKESLKISAVADRATQLVKNQVEALPEGIVVGVELGGSYAKGTWLRGSADVDIFVKLSPAVSEQEFEDLGTSIGKNALARFKPILRYSDHPYVEARIGDIRVNVVPCYNVEGGKWKSAADRSIFHTQYINQQFDADARSQVRLLKRFLKTVGIYGAEISTAGFSGYVCEVLTLKYGSFVQVLQAIAELKERQVISLEGYDSDIVKGFPSPLIIIDPVDYRRNLGTAISPESSAKFILAARAFLKRPKIAFFAKPPSQAATRQLYPFILVVEFSHKQRPPDVIWGQLKRATNAIAKQLDLASFAVVRADCATDEKRSGAFAFILESIELSPFTKRKGPEVFRGSDSERFVEASTKKTGSAVLIWADKDMRLTTLTRRKVTNGKEFVKSLLRHPESSGIPRELIDAGRFRIYSGSERKRFAPHVQSMVSRLASTDKIIFRPY